MIKLKAQYARIGLVLFTGSIVLNTLPSYYEGIKEIKNEPVERIDYKGTVRKVGFYSLMAGWFFIFCVGRGRIPMANIKL